MVDLGLSLAENSRFLGKLKAGHVLMFGIYRISN